MLKVVVKLMRMAMSHLVLAPYSPFIRGTGNTIRAHEQQWEAELAELNRSLAYAEVQRGAWGMVRKYPWFVLSLPFCDSIGATTPILRDRIDLAGRLGLFPFSVFAASGETLLVTCGIHIRRSCSVPSMRLHVHIHICISGHPVLREARFEARCRGMLT